MADYEEQPPPPPPPETSPTTDTSPPPSSTFIIRLMSQRRTWVFLFVAVYATLLSSSWSILRSTLAWYERSSSAAAAASSPAPSSGWPALYASMVLGAVFGLLSMAAALAVAVPATVVTWITVLVLLAFCGKPRRVLVVEGKKLTAEITGFAAKILIKEGNIVAAVCAVLGYFALFRKSREEFGRSESGP